MTEPAQRPVLAGCEPWSTAGGPHGALVLHGITACPQTMRPLAEAFAGQGYTVEVPLLPGHGTSVDDLASTGWADWSGAAEAAYQDLAARCDRVVVAGLSMGGSLTVWLATRHPEVAGIVCINPLLRVADDIVALAHQMLDAGEDRVPAIGGDLADPSARETAYDALPLQPLLSLADAGEELSAHLEEVTCPLLLMTSPQDHVVPPTNSDQLAASVRGPVQRVSLERSYHVATLDHDRDLIAAEAVKFAGKVTAEVTGR
jgi:carboxylesterase